MTSVLLNGSPQELPSGATVLDLVDLFAPSRALAIARNGEIVPRSTWAAVHLEADDRVEVVSAAPGG